MRAEFTEKQPKYKYIKLDDDNADVIILDFIEEIIIENQVPIIAEVNEPKVEDEELIPILSEEAIEQLKADSEIIEPDNSNEGIVEDDTPAELPIEFETITQIIYVYEMNSFRCNPNEITEEIISSNPEQYLDYDPTVITELTSEEMQNDINIDVDFRLSMIELGLI